MKVLLLSFAALAAASAAGPGKMNTTLPTDLNTKAGQFSATLTAVGGTVGNWSVFTYAITGSSKKDGKETALPANCLTASADADGKLTVIMAQTFTDLLKSNTFTKMKITAKGTTPPSAYEDSAEWKPTGYNPGTITVTAFPSALSTKIDTFAVTLTIPDGDQVDWTKLTYTVDGKQDGGSALPKDALTATATQTGMLTVKMEASFKKLLKNGSNSFKSMTISATSNDASIPFPPSPSTPAPWPTTVYTDQLKYVLNATAEYIVVRDNAADEVGTVSLMSTTDNKATEVQPMPSVWLHLMSKDTSSVYATVMATVDQLTRKVTISDYSPATIAFIDGLGSTQIAVGEDTSASASDAENILLCSGEFLAPYIVVTTKDKKNGVLHVAYKGNTCGTNPTVQAVVGGKAAVDVTDGELQVAVNFDDKQATGHFAPSDKMGPTIQLKTKIDGRIQKSTSGTVDVYYVDETAISVMVSNEKPLYIADVSDSITVNATFSKDTTLYPNAETKPLILIVSTDGQSNDLNNQIKPNTADIVDILPLLKEGKSNLTITPTVTAWTQLGNQLVMLSTYSYSFITQVLDVGSASDVSSKFSLVESGSCGVQMNVTFIPTTPVLEGWCFVDGMNQTIYNFTQGHNDTEGRIPLTLDYFQPAKEGQDINSVICQYSLNDAEYYTMAKTFGGGASFTTYQENPLIDALNNNNFTDVIKDTAKMEAVKGCFGSKYNPLVEVTCKNDFSVSMYGNGMSWKYSAKNETDKLYVDGKTNLTTIISDTCGSASILPAALMIALVSVFNIFK